MKHINNFNSFVNESENADYLKWKRENVTLRGIKEDGQENGSGAALGSGLYTAPLSNKALAKQYGHVHFVVGAIPKNPVTFKGWNEWEIWFQTTVVNKFCKENNRPAYDMRFFNENTTIEAEVQKMGYDGIIIKGREMVNFAPENVVYFKSEDKLKHYYYTLIAND